MFSTQIHVVFNCREEERIFKPLIEHPPNKLYYFTAHIRETDQKDEFLDYYERNVKLLKDKIPFLEIITKEIDYTDYIEVIQEISKIINFEREINPQCKIFINISSGSKMTSIASIEASKLWDCKIYYVYSSHYDPYGEGPLHKGELLIKQPITFPIKKPKEIYIKFLKLFEDLIKNKYNKKDVEIKKEKFIYMKYLIDELKSKKFIELESKHNDPGKRKSALYMKANNFLEPLIKDLEYIEISDDKRNKKVYLTEIGQDITKIFKFLI